MDPSLINANLIQLIELRIAELRKGNVHPKHVLDLARMFRRLGCGELLSGNDAGTFFFCLFRAADTYLQFLERKHSWSDLDPYYMARGRAEPLLDALALGDVALAQRIDALAETTWREGMEYEEDFWFFLLLPKLASPTSDAQSLLDGLRQMEQALQGITYPRYDVLKALLHGDVSGFEQGLEALTDAWAAEMEREGGSGMGNPYALSTEAEVFVEGVALVRVARIRGLSIRSEYRLVPASSLSTPPEGLQRQPLWT
ncbi:immunity 49 family protein [Archangium violaceum]|uniref:Imm49 family immunity protein n=1 Tax=Archangium violaceum TaxID=83451 RepID=UPI00193BE3EF|nr:Imm49 family immunity protein [Archangium violaceum]QRK06480.1 immunity 49 family protein [Archangium violaceum]